MNELLSPLSGTPTKADIAALEETRLRASALLSKIFLQYLPKIIRLPGFKKLWQEILQFMELYMKVEDSELLVRISSHHDVDYILVQSEAVRESLKNILLVMSASGIFKPDAVVASETPSSESDIWTFSWAMIDGFCPSLKAEFELIYK
jgi:brefeldin A-resistance guanine nucleotide exchange factor 1